MKKLDYFKLAVTTTTLYEYKGWYISLFAIPMPTDGTSWDKNPRLYDLVKTYTSLSFINKDKDGKFILTPIDDYVKGEPLFHVNDKIKVDSSWGKNITEPTETNIGNLLINKLAIESVFGSKFPFLNGKLNTGRFEEIIANRLRDNVEESKRDPKFIYVDEMLKFNNRIYFLTNLADIFNITATPKNITTAPAMAGIKKQLIKEYGDKLTDPVKLAEFESKLVAVDDEYLKDDPSNGIFISGKVKSLGRKKMHISFGSERGFEVTANANPIVGSLEEGWDTSPEKYTSYINALRAGSYGRGADTVKGGVVAKTMLRSLGGLTVVDQDCGTKIGLIRHITKGTFTKLVNRNINVGGKWGLISDEASAKDYIDKDVEIRSPMYCKASGNHICSQCLGSAYVNNPNAISIAGLEVGAAILTMFLALFHGTILKTIKLELSDICT